ncbi:MAG: glycosyltransferase [Planctomycetota bacterium]
MADGDLLERPRYAYALPGSRPGTAEVLADGRGNRIGILIVAYNAVATLVRVLKRIPAEVWGSVEEVVVFDDASQDATYELAVGYKVLSEIQKLHVIKNQRNLGYGGNQKAGFRYFMEKGFDIVVLLHGDGQYAPEVLSHLYHPIAVGEADAVLGSRMLRDYGGPLRGGMPLYKYVGNRILTVLENWALGMRLSEFHSGYRAYSLRALRQIDFSGMTDDFHFDTEIIIKLHHQNCRIREVPIPTYYGGEICYVNGLTYARDVVRAVYRYKRTTTSVRSFPEFKEYFVYWPPKRSRYSSHYYFELLVGANQDVLDCGCGEGSISVSIAEQGNRVVGIDVLASPGVKSACDSSIRADLSRGFQGALADLAGRKFDKVLLMDVLERLPRPELLLRDCHMALKENGQLLVSVPNVANVTVRMMLMLGRFEYADGGIRDRTHLRFFTRKSARRLLEEKGYRILIQKTTVVPLELVLGLAPGNRLMRLLNRLLGFLTRIMPGLLGYQHVFVAGVAKPSERARSRKGSPGAGPRPAVDHFGRENMP